MVGNEQVILEVKGLKTYFRTSHGEVRAVDGVDLSLSQGKTLGLIGESGCGKTVTSLSIMQLIKSPPGKIAGGQIQFQGRDLIRLSERELQQIRGNSIGMIFQEPMTSLNPVFTIGDQIMEPLMIHRKTSRAEAKEFTLELLYKVGIPMPEMRINEYPHQMSGGMKQRVMIGMAIACGPKVLIADEPTTALDVTMQAQIINLLYDLQKEMGMSILLITHDLGVIAEMAHQVAVMYASKVVEYASVEKLFEQPLHPYTIGLFESLPNLGDRERKLQAIRGQVPNPLNFPTGCKFWPRCPYADQKCRELEPALESIDSGRLVACWRVIDKSSNQPVYNPGKGDRERSDRAQVAESASATGALMEIKELKKFFSVKRNFWGRTQAWLKAVDGVSLSIKEGETLGLVGESGCGKTTVGRTILRLIDATQGDVFFEGASIFSLKSSSLRRMRQKMQIIFQDPYSSLNPRMTVGNIVGEALTTHGIAKGRERKELVENLFAKVGLSPSYIKRYPHEFSGGQRQRIGIARALALNPKFIVCDEVVSALDVSIQAQIMNLLEKLQEENHLSYLFIAHNLAVVEYICNHIAVMYLGQIVEQLPARELVKNAIHPYTRGLLYSNPVSNPSLRGRAALLKGDVPSPIHLPPGCRFHPRCAYAEEKCRKKEPELVKREKDHWVRCWVC